MTYEKMLINLIEQGRYEYFNFPNENIKIGVTAIAKEKSWDKDTLSELKECAFSTDDLIAELEKIKESLVLQIYYNNYNSGQEWVVKIFVKGRKYSNQELRIALLQAVLYLMHQVEWRDGKWK